MTWTLALSSCGRCETFFWCIGIWGACGQRIETERSSTADELTSRPFGLPEHGSFLVPAHPCDRPRAELQRSHRRIGRKVRLAPPPERLLGNGKRGCGGDRPPRSTRIQERVPAAKCISGRDCQCYAPVR